MASGRIEEAHVCLQRATNLNPKDLQAWFALACLMYVGFKIVAPEKDSGFDLSKEYAAAGAIHAKRG